MANIGARRLATDASAFRTNTTGETECDSAEEYGSTIDASLNTKKGAARTAALFFCLNALCVNLRRSIFLS